MPDAKSYRDLPGLKLDDLDRMGACAVCGKPMLQPPAHPMFYCVTVEQAVWDQAAIQRQVGLGMVIGSHPLARLMGPNEDLAKITNVARRVVVHFDCAVKVAHLQMLIPEDAPAGDAEAANA